MEEQKEFPVKEKHYYIVSDNRGISNTVYEMFVIAVTKTAVKFKIVDFSKDPNWVSRYDFEYKFSVMEDLGTVKKTRYDTRT